MILELADTFASIQYLTSYFNKETDLLTWKGVNRKRRELTSPCFANACAHVAKQARGVGE